MKTRGALAIAIGLVAAGGIALFVVVQSQTEASQLHASAKRRAESLKSYRATFERSDPARVEGYEPAKMTTTIEVMHPDRVRIETQTTRGIFGSPEKLSLVRNRERAWQVWETEDAQFVRLDAASPPPTPRTTVSRNTKVAPATPPTATTATTATTTWTKFVTGGLGTERHGLHEREDLRGTFLWLLDEWKYESIVSSNLPDVGAGACKALHGRLDVDVAVDRALQQGASVEYNLKGDAKVRAAYIENIARHAGDRAVAVVHVCGDGDILGWSISDGVKTLFDVRVTSMKRDVAIPDATFAVNAASRLDTVRADYENEVSSTMEEPKHATELIQDRRALDDFRKELRARIDRELMIRQRAEPKANAADATR